MKLNCLPLKKKKVHITPVQQMLNRFEALQKAAGSSSSSAAGKQSSSVHSGARMPAGHTVGKVGNEDGDTAKVPCGTKPKLADRVAHKPTLVRLCLLLDLTRNLSKAHVTHNSSGPATWAIMCSMQ